MHVRVRLRVPPPHVFVHVVNPDQDVQVQSTACTQAARVQACVWVVLRPIEVHVAPPGSASVHDRVLVCTPVPHVTLHADSGPNVPQVQFLGHGDVLQVCVTAAGRDPEHRLAVSSRIPFGQRHS